jgi:hypothetical protein
MDGDVRLGYRLVMAIDVERYSSRSAREQLLVQRDLGRVLDVAAARCGLDRQRWHRQVRGDGELAVLPEATDVAHVVGAFSERLHDTFAELNAARPARSRLRARIAFHHGTLAAGPFGPAGDAPVVVSRLLDAEQLRRALARRPEHDLVVAVSDTLFTDVVRTGFCRLDPLDFEAIQVVAKGITYRGHVHRGPTGGRVLFFPGGRIVAPTRMIADRLEWANRRRLDFTAYEVVVRLARVLAELVDVHGVPASDGFELDVRLSQPELGRLIGVSEDAVGQAMRRLKCEGLVVVHYRRVTIVDVHRLRSFADLAPLTGM